MARSQRHLREIRGKDSADRSRLDAALVPPATAAVEFYGFIEDAPGQDTVAYSLDVSPNFRGTDTPFVYTLQAGTLPTGLTLGSGTGIISGTPSVVATQSGIVIRATDATGADTADTNAFEIDIVA